MNQKDAYVLFLQQGKKYEVLLKTSKNSKSPGKE